MSSSSFNAFTVAFPKNLAVDCASLALLLIPFARPCVKNTPHCAVTLDGLLILSADFNLLTSPFAMLDTALNALPAPLRIPDAIPAEKFEPALCADDLLTALLTVELALFPTILTALRTEPKPLFTPVEAPAGTCLPAFEALLLMAELSCFFNLALSSFIACETEIFPLLTPDASPLGTLTPAALAFSRSPLNFTEFFTKSVAVLTDTFPLIIPCDISFGILTPDALAFS